MFCTYSFWGMHFVWWFFWLILLLWIFAVPYDIPGQRSGKESPYDILKRRFASGELTEEEYQKNKKILEEDTLKSNKK